MSKAVRLVDEILAEHEDIGAEFKSLKDVSGDVEAAARLSPEQRKNDFVPRSLNDQGVGFNRWKQQLESLDRGLRIHFKREETALADAFKEEGTPEMVKALDELLKEHTALLSHIDRLRADAEAIASGGARIEVWEGEGWGMKYNIENLRGQILDHAEREKELFSHIRSQIKKG